MTSTQLCDFVMCMVLTVKVRELLQQKDLSPGNIVCNDPPPMVANLLLYVVWRRTILHATWIPSSCKNVFNRFTVAYGRCLLVKSSSCKSIAYRNHRLLPLTLLMPSNGGQRSTMVNN